jgi:amidase
LALGETVEIETVNSRNAELVPGVVVEEAPKRTEGYGNPVTGPFLIQDIRAGDWIAVHLEDIQVARYGYIRRGGPFLNRSRIVLEAAEGRVHFPGGVSVPAHPMMGVIGVIPREDSADPGPHGGNMDTVDIKAGSIFHVRAQRDGAWFVVGDCHAVQGEGEITCSGVEIDATVQLRIEKSPGFPCQNPVIETPEEWQTMASHTVWADAVRVAYAEMVELVRDRWGLSDEEANVLVGTVAHVKNSSIWGVGGLCLGIGPGLATVRLGLTKDVQKEL